MSTLAAWSARLNLGTVLDIAIFGTSGPNAIILPFGPLNPQLIQLEGGQLVATIRNISSADNTRMQQLYTFSSSGEMLRRGLPLTYTDGSPIRSEALKAGGVLELTEKSDGGFIGVIKDGDAIKLQEYNAQAAPTGTNTLVVAPAAASNDVFGPADLSSVSRLSTLVTYGEQVVRANDLLRLTDMFTLYGKIYNPLTNSYGVERVLVSGSVENFSTHTLPNGNYLIVAGQAQVIGSISPISALPTADRYESIVFKIVSPSGATVVNTSLIAEAIPSSRDFAIFNEYVATALSTSGFVVAYSVRNGTTPGSFTFSNVIEIFDSQGTKIGLRTAPPGQLLAATALINNEFVILYKNGDALRAQHFDGRGNALGDILIDTISFTQSTDNFDIASLQDGRFALTWIADSKLVNFQIFDTRDGFDGSVVNPNTLEQIGTIFDDVFTVRADAPIARGGRGNDTITQAVRASSADAVTISGDEGDDKIIIKNAVNGDKLDGGAGVDTIDWSAVTGMGWAFDLAAGTARGPGRTQSMTGFENLIGTPNGDTIIGTSGPNVLNGGGGSDTISGGDGTDRLIGGTGDDFLNGGAGSDTYDYREAEGTKLPFGIDTITDTSGSDVILLDSRSQIVAAQRVGNDLLLRLKQGEIIIKEHFTTGQIESLADKEKPVVLANGLIGGNAAGIISGSDDGELLDGRGGDDLLYGAGGNDTLLGSEGKDTLQGDGGNDRLDGGDGLDTAQYQGSHTDYQISRTATHIVVEDKIAGRDGRDELVDVERIAFSDSALAVDLDGNAGKLFALYAALLGRAPDPSGMGYFLRYLDGGGTIDVVAAAMGHSSEVKVAISNADLVMRLYAVWLNRAPEKEGFDHWVGRLDNAQGERGSTISDLLASPMVLQAATTAAPGEGIWFT